MDNWIETARQYAENSDYWRNRAERAEELTAVEAELLRTILAAPKFGHHIKGDPDEGEWRCTCDEASDWETAEEHIAKVVFRGAFPWVRAHAAPQADAGQDVERLAQALTLHRVKQRANGPDAYLEHSCMGDCCPDIAAEYAALGHVSHD